jgi:hypothetical protein
MKNQAQERTRLRRLAAVVGTVAVLGAAACAATVREEAPNEEQSESELVSQGHRQPLGPVGVVIDVARTHGNLSAAQEQTLGVISADLAADSGSHRQVREELRSTAIAVVRAGRADPTEVDRAVSQAASSIEGRMRRGADALGEVHALLEPEQRAAVAVELRRRIDEKFRARAEQRQRHGFNRLASHLMLSTLQIDQLKAIKKELLDDKERLRPSREQLLELVSAFETDDFETALTSFQEKKAGVLRKHVARAGRRTETVLGVFTPAQRELLADVIKDGPRKVLLGQRAGESSD